MAPPPIILPAGSRCGQLSRLPHLPARLSGHRVKSRDAVEKLYEFTAFLSSACGGGRLNPVAARQNLTSAESSI